jgi:formate hydrogenlyase transcriptional activator
LSIHVKKNVRISDDERLNHPNIERSRRLKRLPPRPFVVNLSMFSRACSISNKTALGLLYLRYRVGTRKSQEGNYETSVKEVRGRVSTCKLTNGREEKDVDFIHTYSGSEADEIPSSELQAIDSKETLLRKPLPLRLISTEHNFQEIIGESPALKRMLRQVEIVAPTDSTVLLLGETGTGKELIARAIHNLSFRRERTLVKVNCAAIPTGLLEGELFGHEKGAFTGAIAQRIGRFELANRGTIFLDEIGDIPIELQPKLLRVLQEREFERLGSTRTIHIDARVIAATNRDLRQMIDQRKFREDLFYRLNVFPIEVPALRERPEDIPLLVNHFAQRFTQRMNRTIKTVPDETMAALTRYPWPGNIRELQNVIERAVIVCEGESLVIDENWISVKIQPLSSRSLSEELVAREKERIETVLAETRGRVAGPLGAAVRLGIPRSTLDSKIRSLKINTHRLKTF